MIKTSNFIHKNHNQKSLTEKESLTNFNQELVINMYNCWRRSNRNPTLEMAGSWLELGLISLVEVLHQVVQNTTLVVQVIVLIDPSHNGVDRSRDIQQTIDRQGHGIHNKHYINTTIGSKEGNKFKQTINYRSRWIDNNLAPCILVHLWNM